MNNRLGLDHFGDPYEVPQNVDHQMSTHESRLPRRLTALLAVASLALGLSLSGDTTPVGVKSVNPGTVAEKIIDEDAAITGGLECSAFLIRDPRTDQAVGALTAAHCGYANPENITNLEEGESEPAWYAGTSGREYVIFRPGAEETKVGNVSNRLHNVGQVAETLAATNGDSDEAVEVFRGYSLKEVLSDLKNELATDAQIRTMVPGKTKIYDAGWPLEQHGDGHGNEELQRFAATYVGMGTAKIETNKTIDVTWAAFPKNSNGASCTPGMSGSGAFILNDSRPALLGNVSVAYATTASSNAPKLPETIVRQFPGFDWSQYAMICGFAKPTLGQQPDTLLHVITDPDEIPGLEVDSLSDALDLWDTSQYIPTAIEGLVVGTIKSEVDGKLVETTTAYRNPLVFVNDNGSVVIGYYNGQGIQYAIQKFPNISDLTVYAANPNEKPRIVHQSLYALGFDPAQANNLGGFIDQGTEYGTRYTKLPKVNGQRFSVTNKNDDTLALTPTP